MKLLQMIAMVALVSSASGNAAHALGRHMSVEEVTAQSFKCEKLGSDELKKVAAGEIRGDRKAVNQREQTQDAASSL